MASVPYFVYVIQNLNGTRYIGLTEHVATRVDQHNQGISKWTRGKGPWKLVWASPALSRSEALKLEKRVKRQKGGMGFYRITGLVDSMSAS